MNLQMEVWEDEDGNNVGEIEAWSGSPNMSHSLGVKALTSKQVSMLEALLSSMDWSLEEQAKAVLNDKPG